MLPFEYIEEDGYELIRGEDTYYIFGVAQAEYDRDWDGEITAKGFECEIWKILDDEDNEVDLDLTAEEQDMWELYMQEMLDNEAKEY